MTSIFELVNYHLYGGNHRGQRPVTLDLISSITAVPTDPSVVWGMDIAGNYDGIVDWQAFKRRGGRFAIIKITDGTVKVRYAAENVAGAKAAGLIVLGYHWVYRNTRISGTAQANAYFNATRGMGLDGDVLDFEWTWWLGKPDNPNSSDLWGVGEALRALTHRYPIIYSAKGYMDQFFNHDPKWLPYGWFPAQYLEGASAPDMVIPWGNAWTFWQVSSQWPGAELGVDPANSKAEDGDIYNGTLEQFSARFGIRPEEPITYVVERSLLDYDLVFTEGNGELPLDDALNYAEAHGWEAAMNGGAGFTYTDADHAVPKSAGFPTMSGIPYARRLTLLGAINPDLDQIYKAPWCILAFNGSRAALIVTHGLEGSEGLTQMQAGERSIELGYLTSYLMDSGRSAQIEENGQMLYWPYGPAERVPQFVGFKKKLTGGKMKGTAKPGTRSNIKRMSDGVIVGELTGGELTGGGFVYGDLSAARTDLMNFGHYYQPDGTRVDIGVPCKVSIGTNLTITNEAEPGTVTPTPTPAPSALVVTLTVEQGGVLLKPTSITPDGKILLG